MFSDSIPKGSKIKDINNKINGSRIHLKAFTGAKSAQLNHHVLPPLEEYKYDGAIIHVGINDILRCKEEEDIIKIPKNILQVARSCQNHNVRKIFISAILPNRKKTVDIGNINHQLKKLCIDHNFEFIDHPLITSAHLWIDGTHLLDTGKVILANKFADVINDYNSRCNFL